MPILVYPTAIRLFGSVTLLKRSALIILSAAALGACGGSSDPATTADSPAHGSTTGGSTAGSGTGAQAVVPAGLLELSLIHI